MKEIRPHLTATAPPVLDLPSPPEIGQIHIGPIQTIPAILTRLGIDPEPLLHSAGIDPRLFENPTNQISLTNVGRLLEVCNANTGIPHFGLLVGAHFKLEMFGLVGHLMRNEANVREALRIHRLNSRMHNGGEGTNLIEISERRCALTYGVFTPDTQAVGLIYDVAVMIGIRMMKSLCGDSWCPAEVRLSHSPPPACAEYAKLFEAPVLFDEPFTMLVFDKAWLDTPVVGADFEQRHILRRLFAQAPPISLADQIRCVLCNGVMAGDVDVEYFAKLFSMSIRSLQRRLADEKTSLKILTTEARLLVGQQLLTETALPIAEIAAAIGYSHSAAFVRAFRTGTGQSPGRWRQSLKTQKNSTAKIKAETSPFAP